MVGGRLILGPIAPDHGSVAKYIRANGSDEHHCDNPGSAARLLDRPRIQFAERGQRAKPRFVVERGGDERLEDALRTLAERSGADGASGGRQRRKRGPLMARCARQRLRDSRECLATRSRRAGRGEVNRRCTGPVHQPCVQPLEGRHYVGVANVAPNGVSRQRLPLERGQCAREILRCSADAGAETGNQSRGATILDERQKPVVRRPAAAMSVSSSAGDPFATVVRRH